MLNCIFLHLAIQSFSDYITLTIFVALHVTVHVMKHRISFFNTFLK